MVTRQTRVHGRAFRPRIRLGRPGGVVPLRVSTMPARPRLPGALAVSGVLHALALGTLLMTHVGPARTPVHVFPVALVGRLGGGVGGGSDAPPAPAPPPSVAAAEPVVAPPKPVVNSPPHPPRAATRAPRQRPAPAESIAAIASAPSAATEAPGGASAGGGGGGSGNGSGGGHGEGDGGGGAQVAYGSNPLPPYPLAARRLGMEGVTLVDVLVAPDGRPAEVRVRKSSGFALLDDSAVKTVRERWRFVPAREGGAAIESRVTVPIRFRLADAGG